MGAFSTHSLTCFSNGLAKGNILTAGVQEAKLPSFPMQIFTFGLNFFYIPTFKRIHKTISKPNFGFLWTLLDLELKSYQQDPFLSCFFFLSWAEAPCGRPQQFQAHLSTWPITNDQGDKVHALD